MSSVTTLGPPRYKAISPLGRKLKSESRAGRPAGQVSRMNFVANRTPVEEIVNIPDSVPERIVEA